MTLSRMMLVGCLSLVGSALAGCGLGAADRLGEGSGKVVVSQPTSEGDGCTLTQGYWKNHEESWPTSKLTLGGVEYSQEELIELFRTPPKGDTSLILGHQLIAALLNVASGASRAALDGPLADAQAWMAANKDADGKLPYSVKRGAAADEADEAVSLSGKLADFNEGGIGPGHCDDGPGSGSGDPGGSDGGEGGCGAHDGGTGESGEGGSDGSGGDPDGGTGEGGSDGSGGDPGGEGEADPTCSEPCSAGCSNGYSCVVGCCVFIPN